MASITLRTDRFVAAATPGIYLRSNRRTDSAPVGAAIATSTVQSDQTLTFNGLLDNTDYSVYLSGVYVDCSTRASDRGQRFGALQGVRDTSDRRWAGNAATVETLGRGSATGNTAAPATGTLLLVGALIPGGSTISRVGFVSGTTALSVGTNQWFTIVDADTLAILANTANDTSAAWAANTLKELVLTTPLTFVDDRAVYLGLLVTATTVPTLAGAITQTAALQALAPVLAGTSTTGLTVPVAVGTVQTAVTGTIGVPYAYAR